MRRFVLVAAMVAGLTFGARPMTVRVAIEADLDLVAVTNALNKNSSDAMP